MSPLLGLQLESLLGRHSGPKIFPGIPISDKTLAALQSLPLHTVQISKFTNLSPRRAARYGFESTGIVTWMLFPGDQNLDSSVKKLKAKGFSNASVLVGGNFASFAVASARIESLLEVQEKHAMPLYLETHRGTVTESIMRTLQLIKNYPELRFNLDLSHWFVSHRLDLMAAKEVGKRLGPVLERVSMIHARIAEKNDIQSAMDNAESRDFFLEIWRQALRRRAAKKAPVIFIPEVLPAISGYQNTNLSMDRWVEVKTLLSAIQDV